MTDSLVPIAAARCRESRPASAHAGQVRCADRAASRAEPALQRCECVRESSHPRRRSRIRSAAQAAQAVRPTSTAWLPLSASAGGKNSNDTSIAGLDMQASLVPCSGCGNCSQDMFAIRLDRTQSFVGEARVAQHASQPCQRMLDHALARAPPRTHNVQTATSARPKRGRRALAPASSSKCCRKLRSDRDHDVKRWPGAGAHRFLRAHRFEPPTARGRQSLRVQRMRGRVARPGANERWLNSCARADAGRQQIRMIDADHQRRAERSTGVPISMKARNARRAAESDALPAAEGLRRSAAAFIPRESGSSISWDTSPEQNRPPVPCSERSAPTAPALGA